MAEAKAWVMIPISKNKGTEVEIDMHPLVLCKDCKWHDNPDESTKWLPCMEIRTLNNWFCADGELCTPLHLKT